MRRWSLGYLPSILWAAFLLFLGSISHLPEPAWRLPIPLDKVAHFTFYGTLGALVVWGWRRAGRRPRLGLLLGLTMLVGALDELHQGFVPGRDPSVGDWIADSLGILMAALLFLGVSRRHTE